mmetsp:Transcript_20392/g.81554  ORF Transcript_20392/g.81554 Transcript_20392/m.81554 type:complete len:335 (-) Transcript_20392:963-1967(-)
MRGAGRRRARRSSGSAAGTSIPRATRASSPPSRVAASISTKRSAGTGRASASSSSRARARTSASSTKRTTPASPTSSPSSASSISSTARRTSAAAECTSCSSFKCMSVCPPQVESVAYQHIEIIESATRSVCLLFTARRTSVGETGVSRGDRSERKRRETRTTWDRRPTSTKSPSYPVRRTYYKHERRPECRSRRCGRGGGSSHHATHDTRHTRGLMFLGAPVSSRSLVSREATIHDPTATPLDVGRPVHPARRERRRTQVSSQTRSSSSRPPPTSARSARSRRRRQRSARARHPAARRHRGYYCYEAQRHPDDGDARRARASRGRPRRRPCAC